MRGNGQAHYKPRGIGWDAQIEIDKTVTEQSYRAHRCAQLDPVPLMPQAPLDVTKRHSKEDPERNQHYNDPGKPGFSGGFQNVIMGVSPMPVHHKRQVIGENGLKASHSYADPRMASSHMYRIAPYPKPVAERYLQGSIGFKNGPSAATYSPRVDQPEKRRAANQQNSKQPRQ